MSVWIRIYRHLSAKYIVCNLFLLQSDVGNLVLGFYTAWQKSYMFVNAVLYTRIITYCIIIHL